MELIWTFVIMITIELQETSNILSVRTFKPRIFIENIIAQQYWSKFRVCSVVLQYWWGFVLEVLDDTSQSFPYWAMSKISREINCQALVIHLFEGAPIHHGISFMYIYYGSEDVLGQIVNIRQKTPRSKPWRMPSLILIASSDWPLTATFIDLPDR